MTNTVAYILGILTLPFLFAIWMALGWYSCRRDKNRWDEAVAKYGAQYDNLSQEEKDAFDDSIPKWESRDNGWLRTVYIMQKGKV